MAGSFPVWALTRHFIKCLSTGDATHPTPLTPPAQPMNFSHHHEALYVYSLTSLRAPENGCTIPQPAIHHSVHLFQETMHARMQMCGYFTTPGRRICGPPSSRMHIPRTSTTQQMANHLKGSLTRCFTEVVEIVTTITPLPVYLPGRPRREHRGVDSCRVDPFQTASRGVSPQNPRFSTAHPQTHPQAKAATTRPNAH